MVHIVILYQLVGVDGVAVGADAGAAGAAPGVRRLRQIVVLFQLLQTGLDVRDGRRQRAVQRDRPVLAVQCDEELCTGWATAEPVSKVVDVRSTELSLPV